MRSKLEEVERRIQATRRKLESVRKKREHEHQNHEEMKERFAFHKADLSRDLANAHQETSLYEYADAMTEARGEGMVESSYIVAMEAQLCRAVHLMGALNKQLHIVKTANESTAREMEHDLAKETEEKSLVELRMMNALVQADTEKRSMHEFYEKELAEQQRVLATLRPGTYEGGFAKSSKTSFNSYVQELEAKLWDTAGEKASSKPKGTLEAEKVTLASATEMKLDNTAATTA